MTRFDLPPPVVVAGLLCLGACGLDEDDLPELPTAGDTGDPASDTDAEDNTDTDDVDTDTDTDTDDGSSDDSSSGDTGAPVGCDPGCPDGMLCFDDVCYDAGFSIAVGGGTGRQTVYAVATDSENNIVIGGDFDARVDVDGTTIDALGSGRDMFVAKLNPIGELVWLKAFGSAETEHQALTSLAVDGDGNIVIAGEISSEVDFGTGPLDSAGLADVFVAKLDADGNTLWAQAHGGDDWEHTTGVAVDSQGSIALVGDFNGTFDMGGDPLENTSNGPDLWVAKLDADGNHAWSLGSGSDDNQHGRAIAVDGDDNIVVCGEFRGTLDLGEGALSAQLYDAFVGKFSSDGNLQWSLHNMDDGDDYCYALATDADGNIALEGRFESELSFGDDGVEAMLGDAEKYAAKLDPSGAVVWTRHFGTGWDETGDSKGNVAFDSAGNVVLAGDYSIPIDFGGGELVPEGRTVYVAKLDADGDHLSSALYGDDGSQRGYAVAVDALDNILVVGEFSGTLDFGASPPHFVQGNPDGFLARLLP